MACEEKRTLVAMYQQAAQKYSNAVTELNRKIGTSSKVAYEALYRMTEALRIDALQAQEALEKHVAAHHC